MMDANDEMRRPVSEVAAEWFVRLKDGDLTAAERRDYLEWLKKSPEHIAEMLQMSHIYGALRGACKGVQSEMLLSPEEANNIIKLATRSVARPQSPPRSETYRWKIAAVFTMVAVSSLLTLVFKSAVIDRTLETEPNEYRNIPLADGSMLRMGPRTRLSVEFGDSQRLVKLHSGDALFEVAKDVRRPFIVSASPVDVRAVGTEFAVTRFGGNTKVTVREGKVLVTPSEGANLESSGDENMRTASIPLVAGEGLSVAQKWPPTARAVNVDAELAWVEQRLFFEAEDDDTIGTAADEFNRRNRMQIEVVDAELAATPLSGQFDANDPEALVKYVEKEMQAVAVRDKPDVVRLVLRHDRR